MKETGQRKAINGLDTHQAIMTIAFREKGKTLEQAGGMVITSDIWLAPRIAAMQEIGEFELRYARALQGPMVTGASPEVLADGGGEEVGRSREPSERLGRRRRSRWRSGPPRNQRP